MEIDTDLSGKHVPVATAPQDLCISAVRRTLHAQGVEASEAECFGIAKFLKRVAPPSAPQGRATATTMANLDGAASGPSTAEAGQIAGQALPGRTP